MTTINLFETQAAISKLQHSISAIHKEATEGRQQYIPDLANISEDKGDDKKAKILREIAKQDNLKKQLTT